ncbi:hypothetical protein R3P38DRAFT_3450711 [Favolaschia claudopus]|uniref:Uncharacterized protein n=1 Tax=Favolaschia claudopus TaxID=2862362 RepID=A0AAV9ZLW5_9AGAR
MRWNVWNRGVRSERRMTWLEVQRCQQRAASWTTAGSAAVVVVVSRSTPAAFGIGRVSLALATSAIASRSLLPNRICTEKDFGEDRKSKHTVALPQELNLIERSSWYSWLRPLLLPASNASWSALSAIALTERALDPELYKAHRGPGTLISAARPPPSPRCFIQWYSPYSSGSESPLSLRLGSDRHWQFSFHFFLPWVHRTHSFGLPGFRPQPTQPTKRHGHADFSTRRLDFSPTGSTNRIPPHWFHGNLKGLINDEAGFEENLVKEYGRTWKFHRFFGQSALYSTDPKALHHFLSNTHVYQKSEASRFRILVVEGEQHKQQNPVFGVPQSGNSPKYLWTSRYNSEISGLQKQPNPTESPVWKLYLRLAGFNYKIDALAAEDDAPPNELAAAFEASFSSDTGFSFIRFLQLRYPLLRRIHLKRDKTAIAAQQTIKRIGRELLASSKREVLENGTFERGVGALP